MTHAAIQISGLHKRFGRHKVLQGVDLTLPTGKTYAFLGRNGSGKTTTIRMLIGLLRPDSGDITVNGLDPRRDALTIRRSIGYLAEDQQMWGWMKVGEILRFLAPFYPTWNWLLAQEFLDKFLLPGNTRIRHLSKGQNVRLGLLLALAHSPDLVILDDPALGLDPIMRKEFLRDIVTHLQGRDVTVFFSSHLLYEVEPVADIVGILDQGRIVCQAETETLRAQVRQIFLDGATWTHRIHDLRQATDILDIRRDGHRVAAIVRHIDKARMALEGTGTAGGEGGGGGGGGGGVIEEERGLNLDEIFEAFVAGRKEDAHAPVAAVERMA